MAPGVRAQVADDPSFAEVLQQQVTKLLEKGRSAVVRIHASDQHSEIAGTGFLIDPNGLLFTTWSIGGSHDIHDITVLIGDRKLPAHTVATDERAGIALLKVDARTPFLPFGNSRELKVGSPVLAIGYPLDLPLTPSFGVLGGFDRQYLGLYFATTHLRANVAVQRGEGGAPLLNMKGEVVGMLISSLDNGSASFVLPVEAAEKVRRDYVRFGEVRPGWLGVSLEATTEPISGSTARVRELFPGGPAEKAGVKPDDVVLRIGQSKIASPEDMLDVCFFLSAEDQVAITVGRGDEQIELKAEAGDPPGHHPLHEGLGANESVAPLLQSEGARASARQ